LDTQKSVLTEEQSDLASNLNLLNDAEKLQNIGSVIVKQAIVKSVMAKVQESVLIEKGEVASENLQKLLKIQLDVKGKTLGDWSSKGIVIGHEDEELGYCEVLWAESSKGASFDKFINVALDERLQSIAGFSKSQLSKVFTSVEIEALNKHGLIK
jgi:hypothetical protein